MFNDHVGAMFVSYRSSETRFDLFCNGEVVKDGNIPVVEFDDMFAVWCNESYIVVDFVENIFVVNIDVFVRRIKQIA